MSLFTERIHEQDGVSLLLIGGRIQISRKLDPTPITTSELRLGDRTHPATVGAGIAGDFAQAVSPREDRQRCWLPQGALCDAGGTQ